MAICIITENTDSYKYRYITCGIELLINYDLSLFVCLFCYCCAHPHGDCTKICCGLAIRLGTYGHVWSAVMQVETKKQALYALCKLIHVQGAAQVCPVSLSVDYYLIRTHINFQVVLIFPFL